MQLAIFYNLKNHFVYKLLKTETDLRPDAVFEGIEMVLLERIGDDRIEHLSRDKMLEKYEQLDQYELEALGEFMSKNLNSARLPVKYTQGRFKLGKDKSTTTQAAVNEAVDNMVKQRPEDLLATIGQVITPSVNEDFSKVISHPETIKAVKQGLAKIELQDFLNNTWNMKSVNEGVGKSILNFYGLPGTGKSMTARAVAKSLNKKILQVDYAQVESKWVGETGKNIQKIFDSARKNDAVLFFDEADSLVSARVKNDGSQMANYVNENRNIFMQELDKHKGVVILTTNLFENFDEAMLRRVSQHVEFKLPSMEMREQILRQQIPSAVPQKGVDYTVLAQEAEGLSGGDLKNVAEESLTAAAQEGRDTGDITKSVLEQKHLLAEIVRIKQAKAKHKGLGNKKTVGFNQ